MTGATLPDLRESIFMGKRCLGRADMRATWLWVLIPGYSPRACVLGMINQLHFRALSSRESEAPSTDLPGPQTLSLSYTRTSSLSHE